MQPDAGLPFTLPDYTRISWASARARATWEPRIRRFGEAWTAIERWTVADKVRSAALQDCPPEALPGLVEWGLTHGLVVLPLGRQVQVPTYGATGQPAKDGQPWNYRVAIVQLDQAAAWLAAWKAGDDDTMGRLLGFPACCRAFFRATWGHGLIDTTWQAAGGQDVAADSPVEANILGRWFGVRLVPHLPCSFSCPATVSLAGAFRRVGRSRGYANELADAKAILSWPMAWSALHGLGEITTPILRVSTRTNATAGKLVVRRHGTAYPAEGASGLVFPFQRQPVAAPAPVRMVRRDTWTANGFSSQAAQAEAHRVLVDVAKAVPLADGAVVLDLGCGNGALLRHVKSAVKACQGTTIRLAGIEQDGPKLAGSGLDWMATGDLVQTQWPANVALVLLMPGRLIEAQAEHRAGFLARLAASGAVLLVYGYGDWLTRHGGLVGLAEAAGLNGRLDLRAGPGVEAAILSAERI